MIIFVQCPECDGDGRLAKVSAMDPFDPGEICWRCKGEGGWDEDMESEIEE